MPQSRSRIAISICQQSWVAPSCPCQSTFMQPATVEPTSPSRRRPRLSSSSSTSPSAAKRPRFSDSSTMASAKARGKMPEVIDLTKRQSAFQPHSGARKLVIKNLRSPVNHEARIQEYYARTERELEEALDAIFSNKSPAIPLERLYRGVEDMCRSNNAEKVYRTLKDKVDKHLKTIVLPKIQSAAKVSSLEVLRRTLAEWKTWNSQTVGLHPSHLIRMSWHRAHSIFRSSSGRLLATLTAHICSSNPSHQ